MYAHGLCLYVYIESTSLYVVSISLHAQRYIPVLSESESVPVPESQSNGISVLGAPGTSSTQYWFIMMEDRMYYR